MSIHLATSIVRLLGPARIIMDASCGEALARELGLLGCAITGVPDGEGRRGTADPARSTAGIVNWQADRAPADQLRPFRHADRLIVLPTANPRARIEQQLFAAGWERHPGAMSDGDYAGRDNPATTLSLFRRTRLVRRHSPLRASDAQADACIARYALAARIARPGDRVLVDGAAAEVGGEILGALSRAGTIIGDKIVGDKDADATAPGSIDLIVAFDPGSGGWRERLDRYAGLLKPDGRVIVGWPRGDGESAPADWPSLEEALCERLLLEARYLHSVPAGNAAPRALGQVETDAPDLGDWLIAVASANPLGGETHRAAYRHPFFASDDAATPTLVDFGAAYDNPYLYRVMVQMGERLGDEVKLARLAEIVTEQADPASADRGAGLAVLGYRVLEHRMVAAVAPLLAAIDAYRAATAEHVETPHVARWRLSLAFLAARLCELVQDRDGAIRWFALAAGDEWSRFSPLLATKAVAAAFHEGRLHLADGNGAAARRCFRHGLDTSLAAMASPHGALIGSHDRPVPFYMQELAEVADMGSQCANALTNMTLWERDPGLFWRQVDIRRFGLASWARDLERENQQLRAGR